MRGGALASHEFKAGGINCTSCEFAIMSSRRRSRSPAARLVARAPAPKSALKLASPCVPVPQPKAASAAVVRRPEIVRRNYHFSLPAERVLDWGKEGLHTTAWLVRAASPCAPPGSNASSLPCPFPPILFAAPCLYHLLDVHPHLRTRSLFSSRSVKTSSSGRCASLRTACPQGARLRTR